MDGRAVFLGLAFALMWSSAFTSARIIVAYAPPLYSLSARFLISGLIGVIIALILGQSWRLSRKQWISVAVFGVCQNALYLGLNFVAMQTVEASLAAIIASTMPLIVACAGWIIFRERLSTLGICGLIAGLIGVALIMGSRIQADVDLFGIALWCWRSFSCRCHSFDAWCFLIWEFFDDCWSSDVGWKPDFMGSCDDA